VLPRKIKLNNKEGSAAKKSLIKKGRCYLQYNIVRVGALKKLHM
jgi:hypothetical protein